MDKNRTWSVVFHLSDGTSRVVECDSGNLSWLQACHFASSEMKRREGDRAGAYVMKVAITRTSKPDDL